ncbi:MAG: ribonuclease HII [Candidatus Micrarchaeota archaeon]
MGSVLIGIDEAGRGSVIGHMIISCAICSREDEKLLNALGKKDSKQLTAQQREATYNELKKFCRFKVCEIPATELNQMMATMSLNDIEAKKMALLLKNLTGDIMIDLPDRYSWTFKERMERFGVTKFQAQHKADENYPIVAAASICAKVIRDRKIEEIKQQTQVNFGSGYPSDEKTREALRRNFKELKEHIRHRWKTLETIKQTKLFEPEASGQDKKVEANGNGKDKE